MAAVLDPPGATGADNGDITGLEAAVDLALLEVAVVLEVTAGEDAVVLDVAVAVFDVAVEDAGLLLPAARCFRALLVVLGRAP